MKTKLTALLVMVSWFTVVAQSVIWTPLSQTEAGSLIPLSQFYAQGEQVWFGGGDTLHLSTGGGVSTNGYGVIEDGDNVTVKIISSGDLLTLSLTNSVRQSWVFSSSVSVPSQVTVESLLITVCSEAGKPCPLTLTNFLINGVNCPNMGIGVVQGRQNALLSGQSLGRNWNVSFKCLIDSSALDIGAVGDQVHFGVHGLVPEPSTGLIFAVSILTLFILRKR